MTNPIICIVFNAGFEDILDMHSCKNIVQSMIAASIDSNLFTRSYLTWTNKNSTLMEIKL